MSVQYCPRSAAMVAPDEERAVEAQAPAPGPPAREPQKERKSRWRRLGGLLAFALVIGALFAFLPGHVDELREELRRMEAGDWRWLVFAALLEILSFGGYVVLFRSVFSDEKRKISWGESYQITMAGVVATRLFAAAGAGGVALTAWALRRAGMQAATVARRMVEFLVVLYAVYALSLVVAGAGLYAGVLPGPAPLGLTLPIAGASAVAICLALATTLVPSDLAARFAGRRAAVIWLAKGASTVAGGVRDAVRLLRRDPVGALGAPIWWFLDIAVLWACFKAFGVAPTPAVLVMAYFVGTLGNLLPLPGGVGGVDGGIIAALVGFGVSPGIAFLAVLTHRVFAFWLPTIPGGIAYLQLRRTVGRWDRDEAPAPAPV
jgi:uncharacterized membrane protein YbhN (UPF0104 family)